ncbi:MAG: glycoside hydrolase family 3 protein [Acidobacteria bacterium]|nr:MAG: glycoside hydrolase family 3 protein [Acidobacteriota bacterium]
MKKPLLFIVPLVMITAFAQTPPYLNPDLPVDQRAKDLVSRMTLEEKIAQLNYAAPAIPRLNVPEYNWWSESLHGVARNGRATVFPQAIGLAATFDDNLLFRIATAISDEARAKFKSSQAIGFRGQNAGLTFWAPNINIYRDPRWGRGQETYGEDPFLTSRMGVAYVKGMQGDNPKYLKTAACAKHYAVHSGPEGLRHEFNVEPSKKDLRETYLPAFKALVTEAKVEIVMCAYHRLYGDPCCGSKLLLQDILRKEWGFQGHVTSDCWALVDFYQGHKLVKTPEEAAALAFKTGVDTNCGSTSPYLKGAVEKGLITEAQIDQALTTLLKTRFRLGLFDPPERNPYTKIGPEVINSQEHRDLAREAAQKSIVLLKNKNNLLPLKKDIKQLYVMGPNAADANILLGNYYGITGNLHTILEGIAAAVHPGTNVDYRQGFLLDRENINPTDWTTGDAHKAQAIIVVMGLSGLIEGEEGEALASPTKSDRYEMGLPANQVNYLKKLRAAGNRPIILVLTGGSPVAIPEVHDLADAILYVWYPGEEGGTAIADVLFGNVAPSGRLPITFPRSVAQLPPYEDYSMKGRTYRYMQEDPLYPFGFGLSYATFAYSDLQVSKKQVRKGDSVEVTAVVKNDGKVAAEEVVQCYLTDVQASVPTPAYDLRGFKRVKLAPEESQKVTFSISPEAMQLVNNNGEQVLEPGDFRVTIAGAAPVKRSVDLGAAAPVSAVFTVN